ncbi:TonB-dependent receptor [Reichenbachiella ulvae]|uniref:TonB-dependent receptor n=1 Tax=Reichenbachiella ulvae TaxID=2980104 RepID=A0ABT3CW21_9BACT|nr:TonB-dependent receptor [Reichenbachiella ulvae]MCV9387766.1 TonB-dependent receptor [Reichenbachiella ulvae]
MAQSIDSTDQILEVVTISSDLFEHQQIEFGGSVSALSHQQLERADALNLQPVLNSVPGVFMQSGTLSTNRITIRGIGSRSPFGTDKIKAYLDDIPLSSGEGETTLEDIDFATLRNVEVYRGPVSTVFGAGLGGAIHLQSRELEPGTSASLDAMVGSFGLRKYNVRAQVADEKKSLGLFYQDVHSDGYRDNNNYDRQSITALARAEVFANSKLSLYANYTSLTAQIPSSLNQDDYNNNPEGAAFVWGDVEGQEDSERMRLGLSLRTQYNPRTQSTVTLFFNAHQASEIRPSFLGDLESDQANGGIRAHIKRSFLSQNQLQVVMGVEGFLESYRYQEFSTDTGDKELDYDQNRSYGNVFLAAEYYPTDDWIVSIGGNMNGSAYQLSDELPATGDDQSGDYNFTPVFSPKLSLTRKLTSDIAAYALVSQGFSLPSFEQSLHPDGAINYDLKPESGWNYELGIKGRTLGQKLYFELVGYRMKTQDLIVDRTIDAVTYGVNAGSAIHDGIEVLLDHRTLESSLLTINQRLSYSWMSYHFDEFVDGADDYSGNRMTGVPQYNLDYSIDFKLKMGLYLIGNLQAVGSQSILDDSSLYTDAYQLIHAKLGYEKKWNNLKLNLYAGVNNLTDTKYASMLQINAGSGRYYYPGLPINYFGGVKLGYGF